MSATDSALLDSATAVEATETAATAEADVQCAIDAAVARIAPLFPLSDFVAVNPFLGFADTALRTTARHLATTAGARLSLSRAAAIAAIDAGELGEEHLQAALDDARPHAGQPLPVDAPALIAHLRAHPASADPTAHRLPTIAEHAGTAEQRQWAAWVVEHFGTWAASWFDHSWAACPSPWRHLEPWPAWRAERRHDPAPALLGLRGFTLDETLSEDPRTAIATMLDSLAIRPDLHERYLERLLRDVGGWVALARHRAWQAGLAGGEDDTAVHLLAVRLAYECGLAAARPFGLSAWQAALDDWQPTVAADDRELTIDLLLQEAWERAEEERLLAAWRQRAPVPAKADPLARPALQVACCIDVRSEVLRRAIEQADGGIETHGFAGFFGVPVAQRALGEPDAEARCPALLAPGLTVDETVHGLDANAHDRVVAGRRTARLRYQAWKSFTGGAVSCFGFVGPLGLGFLPKLVTAAFGLSRPVPAPRGHGIARCHHDHLGPDANAIPLATRVELATGILAGMSLQPERLARVVALIGHASTSVNNPHAAGLDCGACNGHGGGDNAVLAAAILNDPAVRALLAEQGQAIPDDTRFVAGEHNTTTDEVQLMAPGAAAADHGEDLARLQRALVVAGATTRQERAAALELDPARDLLRQMRARGGDWAQVRPEWGLAGCRLFIAAPRAHSADLDLGGRAFLHDYRWQADEGFQVLELILTAPLVVASWINLQYFASTTDNRVFGSGDKTLHQVVAGLGVVEGNGGDLRTGLPWQSVHDGRQPAHRAQRLSSLVAAPIEAITRVLDRHAGLRALCDAGWLRLHALDDDGRLRASYRGELQWTPSAEEGGA